MNSKTKRLIFNTIVLICVFCAGGFFQHLQTGHHYKVHEKEYYEFELGMLQWEHVTDSVGFPLFEPGTTQITFRVSYSI